ncbi:hypothetical protein DER46DRAFT_573494 [Fusarium sp. MPI-SDFR-AT-0072]|nr:hypothetical protein DER46DRAFT_573494 [Fusarium sp. MPI-SDFR-AT-0072]
MRPLFLFFPAVMAGLVLLVACESGYTAGFIACLRSSGLPLMGTISASKQPKYRFKYVNYYIGDPIPCNSVTYAAYSKDKKPVDLPDDLAISTTTLDNTAIY